MTARPLVRHDELLLERILLSVDPTRLRELVSDQIGPLIEADRTGSGALCQTLETYLGIGNAAEAARELTEKKMGPVAGGMGGLGLPGF